MVLSTQGDDVTNSQFSQHIIQLLPILSTYTAQTGYFLYLSHSFCINFHVNQLSSLLRFSYYGNFGFGLLAFSLGFLLALLQLKEPQKEKSDAGPGEGESKKLVSLENLTNSFKVFFQIANLKFKFMCLPFQIYPVPFMVVMINNFAPLLHQGFGEEEIRQPAPHRHSPCCSFYGW